MVINADVIVGSTSLLPPNLPALDKSRPATQVATARLLLCTDVTREFVVEGQRAPARRYEQQRDGSSQR